MRCCKFHHEVWLELTQGQRLKLLTADLTADCLAVWMMPAPRKARKCRLPAYGSAAATRVGAIALIGGIHVLTSNGTRPALKHCISAWLQILPTEVIFTDREVGLAKRQASLRKVLWP